MALIIIEGPDSTGKTTLAKFLAEKLDFEYYHFSAPKSKEEAKKDYFNFINKFSNKNVIVDRAFWGEFVYAPIWRNYEPDYFNELEAKLKKQIALNILLYKSKPFENTENSPEILSQHSLILHRFIEIFNKIKSTDKIIFNLDNFPSKEEFLDFAWTFVRRWILNKKYYYNTDLFRPFQDNYYYTIFNPKFRFINGNIEFDKNCNKCKLINEHKQYEFWKKYNSITFGVGNLKSKVVFVGEAPGYKGCGYTGIPFYRDKSGMLFREILFKHRILETEFYLTNVIKCNPKDNLIQGKDILTCPQVHLLRELEYVRPQIVIAIGKTAQYILEKFRYSVNFAFEIEYINHPAFYLYKKRPNEFYYEIEKIRKYFE